MCFQIKLPKTEPDLLSAEFSVVMWFFSGQCLALRWHFDGTLLKSLDTHQANVLSVKFSPNGQILASADADGKIILWNLNLDKLLVEACQQVYDYLQINPNISESDRLLCGIKINYAEKVARREILQDFFICCWFTFNYSVSNYLAIHKIHWFDISNDRKHILKVWRILLFYEDSVKLRKNSWHLGKLDGNDKYFYMKIQ